MQADKPLFFDSPYFEILPEWHILPGAPQEIIDSFNDWMKLKAEEQKRIEAYVKTLNKT